MVDDRDVLLAEGLLLGAVLIGGRNSCCAMIVGTNAERIATVIRSVYWAWLIRWWVSPNSAAIKLT